MAKKRASKKIEEIEIECEEIDDLIEEPKKVVRCANGLTYEKKYIISFLEKSSPGYTLHRDFDEADDLDQARIKARKYVKDKNVEVEIRDRQWPIDTYVYSPTVDPDNPVIKTESLPKPKHRRGT